MSVETDDSDSFDVDNFRGIEIQALNYVIRLKSTFPGDNLDLLIEKGIDALKRIKSDDL